MPTKGRCPECGCTSTAIEGETGRRWECDDYECAYAWTERD